MENSESPDSVDYIVQNILGKRIRNGIAEYLIKWKGYSSKENSWEPECNLDCFELIQEYEEVLSKHEEFKNCSSNKCLKNNNTNQCNGSIVDEKCQSAAKMEIEPSNGFLRGLEPENILGATDYHGELMLLMKWKNGDLELISSREAKEKCPILVIDFYEKHVKWRD